MSAIHWNEWVTKKKKMASNLEAGRGGAHGIMGWKAQVLEERAKKGDGMWGEYR